MNHPERACGIEAHARLPRSRGKVSRGSVAVGCALAIAACGGSGSLRTATRASGSARAVVYAGCMRSREWRTSPTRARAAALTSPPRSISDLPSMCSPGGTCAKLLPVPVAIPTISGRYRLALVAAAKCLRAHGIEVADPGFSGPTSPSTSRIRPRFSRRCSSGPNGRATTLFPLSPNRRYRIAVARETACADRAT